LLGLRIYHSLHISVTLSWVLCMSAEKRKDEQER
jgi:hypothetical protein